MSDIAAGSLVRVLSKAAVQGDRFAVVVRVIEGDPYSLMVRFPAPRMVHDLAYRRDEVELVLLGGVPLHVREVGP